MTGIVGAGLIISPFLACETAPESKDGEASSEGNEASSSEKNVFTLPALGYAFDALEPAIDKMTMEIHHDLHHGGYVAKLNKALTDSSAFQDMTLVEIMASVNAEDTAIRNNGGGHYNHSLYWRTLKPEGALEPSGALYDALIRDFGAIENFQRSFQESAKTLFGSGWAWLSLNEQGQLFVSTTPNQDNPLMKNIVEKSGVPLLGIDVWEHAYYLNYQNLRADYIKQFMGLINWKVVSENYASALHSFGL